MKQIYHNYNLWEEHHAGLWKKIYGTKREILLKKAIEFTGNTKLYGSYMLEIIKKWPYSCEQNLSDPSLNRRAWLGHAACCLAIRCPEEITRLAWHFLTKEQQDKANMEADNAIRIWEETIKDKINIQKQLNLFDYEKKIRD